LTTALLIACSAVGILFAMAGCSSKTQTVPYEVNRATMSNWCMVKLGMTLPQVHSIIGPADKNYTRENKRPGKEPRLDYFIDSARRSVFFDSTYHVARVTAYKECPSSPAQGSPL
jgi:hypothetical protein